MKQTLYFLVLILGGCSGKDLPPEQWKELLEELGADIDGHLDAILEEAEEKQ